MTGTKCLRTASVPPSCSCFVRTHSSPRHVRLQGCSLSRCSSEHARFSNLYTCVHSYLAKDPRGRKPRPLGCCCPEPSARPPREFFRCDDLRFRRLILHSNSSSEDVRRGKRFLVTETHVYLFRFQPRS